eukprot:SAG22_NODE_1240_length_5042_cov_103.645964_9_plen_64_part_00
MRTHLYFKYMAHASWNVRACAEPSTVCRTGERGVELSIRQPTPVRTDRFEVVEGRQDVCLQPL